MHVLEIVLPLCVFVIYCRNSVYQFCCMVLMVYGMVLMVLMLNGLLYGLDSHSPCVEC